MAYFGNEPAKVAVKVGSGVITATELADDSITTADIIADAITPTELDEDGTGFQVGTLGVGAAVSGGHTLLVSGTSSFSGNTFTSGYFQSNASGIGFRLANQSYDSLYYSASNRIGFSGSTTQRFDCTAATFTGTITSSGNISSTAGNIDIAATKKIFLDGGGDTYIQEDSANNILLQSTSATFAGTIKTKGAGNRTIALESTDNAQNLNIDYIDNAGNPYSRIRWREGDCDWTFQSNVTSSSTDLVTISNTGIISNSAQVVSTGNASGFVHKHGTTPTNYTHHSYDGIYTYGAQHMYLQTPNGYDIKFYPEGTLRCKMDGDTFTYVGDINAVGAIFTGTLKSGAYEIESDTYPQLKIDGTDNSGNVGIDLHGPDGTNRGKWRWNSSNNDVEFVAENGNVTLSLLDESQDASFAGKLTINGAGTANSPSLAIDNPSSSAYIHALEAFGANMTQGQIHIFCLGKEGSTKNTAVLGYKWDSAGSNSNLFTIEHWGTGPLVTVDGVGTTTFEGSVRIGNGKKYGLNGTDEDWYIGKHTSHHIDINGGGASGSGRSFRVLNHNNSNAEMFKVDFHSGEATFKGDVFPAEDGTQDLGSDTKRWANVYTGDLHLKNDKGDWTIVEGEDELFVHNNLTGKKYTMMMKEVS